MILRQLEAEVDELWSFVGKKANRQWLRIALEAQTRQVLAFHVGDRSRQSAVDLWQKILKCIGSTLPSIPIAMTSTMV